MAKSVSKNRINLDVPRWPQDNFVGRFKHFWSITDWRNGLNSEETFDNAKTLLNSYRYVHTNFFVLKVEIFF